MSRDFTLRLGEQSWLGEPSNDLCSHGYIFLRVRDKILSDGKETEWTIAESALTLLQTVMEDFPNKYVPRYYGDVCKEHSSLIYHCGCYMLFCPTSIGWTVIHKQDKVILKDFTKDEQPIKHLHLTLSRHEYAHEIYHFAIQAKEFYNSHVKNIKQNELFEGQYQLFWQEYDELLKKVQTVPDFV